VGSYSQGGQVGPACWPHYDLIIVLEGVFDLTIDGSTISCKAGDACLIPPDHLFRGIAGSGGITIWVQHFSVRKQTSKMGFSFPLKPVRWPGVGQWEWPRTLMARLSRLQNQPDATILDNPDWLLLAILLEEFKRAGPVEKGTSAAERIVQRLIDRIENHALPLPTLKEISEFSGWSVSFLRHRFRSVTGRTIGEFLKQRRMAESARLLAETRKPIKEIAMQAGYGDVAAFHRAFLERYKITPGQYRDRCDSMV